MGPPRTSLLRFARRRAAAAAFVAVVAALALVLLGGLGGLGGAGGATAMAAGREGSAAPPARSLLGGVDAATAARAEL
jgi:hypothetical protein